MSSDIDGKETYVSEKVRRRAERPRETCSGMVYLGGEVLEQCWDPIKRKAYFYFQGINPLFPQPELREESWDDVRDVVLVPITVDKLVEKVGVLLPKEPIEYGDEITLFRDIRRFIRTWVDVDEWSLDMLALYVMFTWLYDKARALPYITLRGGAECGKSRLGETLCQISYRGIKTSGSSSFSATFRIEDRWRGTVFINEGDLTRSNEDSQMTRYLNCGYEHGVAFHKSVKDKPEEQNSFYCFGPKILTTRKAFADDGLESRCLVIPMRPMKRKDIPYNFDNSFDAAALELRNKLLMFRFRNHRKFEVNASIRFPGASPRLNQILQPLASLAELISKDLFDAIKLAVAGFEERLVEDRAESEDGLVVRAYLLVESEGEFTTSTAISAKVKEIGGSEITKNMVGRRLRALSFTHLATKDGNTRYYKVDERERAVIIRKYVPSDEWAGIGFSDGSDGSDGIGGTESSTLVEKASDGSDSSDGFHGLDDLVIGEILLEVPDEPDGFDITKGSDSSIPNAESDRFTNSDGINDYEEKKSYDMIGEILL